MRPVLLLDDDSDLRALLRSSLATRGIEVLEAGRASEADEVLRSRSVALVVVDGLLPDGLGIQFIERLRSRDREIRVVFMSSFFRDLGSFMRLTHELDVSVVIHKPVDPESFAGTVDALVRAEPADSGASEPSDACSSALDLELAELRTQFGVRLPGKLDELATAISRAKLDAEALAAARALAHRLRGSSGSYGYGAVGEAVGRVEDLLEEALQGGAVRSLLFDAVDGFMADARRSAAHASDLTGGAEIPSASPKALLVVDDDPDFLEMVKSTAAKLLVELLMARTFDEALLHAQKRELFAAIIDVHLEGEDSYLLAGKIRETEGNSDTSIAFISVDRRLETRVSALEAGGTKYLEKPIPPESFCGLVERLLRLSQAQQGRVLIVDPDGDISEHYARHLRSAGFLVELLDSADTLIDRLDATRPDVLLIEAALPRVAGIDVCRALRTSERWELLPILVVTARIDAETRLRAFRAGASDVIAKPILPEELLARVGVQSERVRLLRDRADKDSLSGLLLRRAFVEAFQRSLAICSREGKPLSLVLLDLDHFKSLNDTYGHLAGDQVIARLGDLLLKRFRADDLRGRWGGEEFVIAFPGMGAEFAVQAIRRLLREFSALRFSTDDKRLFGATFTAGIAAYPGDGASISALIRHADALLYAGKREGRAQVAGNAPSKEPVGSGGAAADGAS